MKNLILLVQPLLVMYVNIYVVEFQCNLRRELIVKWKDKGITQEKDYAILTNERTKTSICGMCS